MSFQRFTCFAQDFSSIEIYLQNFGYLLSAKRLCNSLPHQNLASSVDQDAGNLDEPQTAIVSPWKLDWMLLCGLLCGHQVALCQPPARLHTSWIARDHPRMLNDKMSLHGRRRFIWSQNREASSHCDWHIYAGFMLQCWRQDRSQAANSLLSGMLSTGRSVLAFQGKGKGIA